MIGAVRSLFGRFFSRLWPDTMAGQLIGLLLCGLLGAHLFAVLLSSKGDGGIHTLSRRQVIDNTVVAWRLAQQHDANTALAAFDSPTVRFRRADAQPAMPPASSDAVAQREVATIDHALRGQLTLPPDAVRIGWRSTHLEAAEPELALALRLPDGAWLDGMQRPTVDRQWWRPLRFSVPVSTLPVLVIVIIFVRRILRPALAHAADRVSRGEYGAPLALAGPREARELTEAFNVMQARLTRYLDDQRQMLASINHDLRSLVTTLRLRAELIDDEALRTAMQRTLCDMAAMIEETLRFARDDAVDEPSADLDLGALLRELVADQQALGRDVALLDAKAPALSCRCRPLALKRALNNLVENAVRYGGGARIRYGRTRPAGKHPHLAIAIEDDGPGIAPAQLENVFKPFYRLDAARHPETGGVGLGLAIARSCVEAHGGKLVLENREGQGLRALVTLPV